MVKHTYWLSIGHSVNGAPQDVFKAEAFRNDVRGTVVDLGGNIIATVNGRSTWGGAPEDTTLFLVTIPAHNVSALRRTLATIAHHYEQSTIGLVGGDSQATLVYAFAHRNAGCKLCYQPEQDHARPGECPDRTWHCYNCGDVHHGTIDECPRFDDDKAS